VSTVGQRWTPSLRRQLEDAVIADLPKGLPYLKTAERYGGQFSGKDRVEEIREALAGRTPGVLVMSAGAVFRTPNVQRSEFTKDLELHVYCCDSSFESPEAGSAGDEASLDGQGGSPGAYTIMEHVVARLTRLAPADGIGVLVPSKEDPIIVHKDLHVWLVIFNVDLDATIPDRRLEGVEDLEEIAGRVNVGPASENAIASGTGSGIGDNFARTGSTVTLTVTGMGAIGAWVGLQLVITGAKNANNNGTFDITAVPGATQVQFTNGRGSPEVFGGQWKIIPPPAARMLTT
jgi:hypothetical protein